MLRFGTDFRKLLHLKQGFALPSFPSTFRHLTTSILRLPYLLKALNLEAFNSRNSSAWIVWLFLSPSRMALQHLVMICPLSLNKTAPILPLDTLEVFATFTASCTTFGDIFKLTTTYVWCYCHYPAEYHKWQRNTVAEVNR